MTGARFLLSFAALPLLGLASWALPGVARLPPWGRASAAAASGALLLAVEMFLFHLAGVRWSLPALAAPLVLLGVAATILSRGRIARRRAGSPRPWGALVLGGIPLALATYAAATARATSVDLLLFWGTRGARFAAAGGIDVPFLADPRHRFMHPDYPPLLPFLYAWGTLASGRFPWGAALLTMPLFILLAGLALGTVGRSTGDPEAPYWGGVLVALLSFTGVASLSAGNAEPPLLFFETLALAGIAYGRGIRRLDAVASLGLAGAVWTKVEGAMFAALATACFLWLHRRDPKRWSRLLAVAGPAAGLLAAWLLWAGHNGLLQGYLGRTYGAFSTERWTRVLAELAAAADYGVFYLPWIAVLLLLAHRGRRGGFVFAVAAALFVLFTFFSYLHGSFDPGPWIRWSAPRLLMTPLVLLLFAALPAASEAGKAPESQAQVPRR